MEWANLPHDYAEALELIIVSISVFAMLGIMVLFGKWWQR
jgi:predicted RND superfamily exporter protein